LAIPLLLVVSFSVFALVSFMPGNPATILAGTNPELVPYITKELKLDKPLPVQYVHWIGRAVQGDLGLSWVALTSGRHESVASEIIDRAPITLAICGFAILLSLILGLSLGMLGATRSGWVDRVVTAFSALCIAVPGFWLGFVLILWFGVRLGWLPVFGYVPLGSGFWQWLSHIILPAVTLAIAMSASLTLQFRGALLDVLGKDYILSARAKGLKGSKVLWKHAMKNAFAPVATILGFQLANLLGATVIIENVFNIPGLGTLAVSSTFGRDIPVILGLLVCTTLLVVIVNTLLDLVYAYLNPRVRAGVA
jgi:peptide/nickel transport system permease protein